MERLTSARDANAPRPPEIGLSMTQIIKNPLAGLRASMERLAADFREDPRGSALNGALAQVLRMSRDVEALVEYASPRALAPLRCSLEEILHAALKPFAPEQRARIKLAKPDRAPALVVDGPALASALSRILDSALEAASEWVLLQARCEGSSALFVAVDGASTGVEPTAPLPLASARAAALQLGLALARRDLERMGGGFEIESTERGYTRWIASLPDCFAGAPR